jgi:DNA-binding transcriptional LysR family regulator
MAKLDIGWLDVFIEVHKTRSVSRAAEQLGIAQPNASIALRKLRGHFGDRLFVRTSRGMEPTPYAQRIYPEVVASVERLADLAGARATFDAATAQRQFRICMTDTSHIVVLPKLVNHVRRVAPGIAIEAEHITTESPRLLESGEIDLAVGFMPHLEAGFRQQTLFNQDFVCLVAADHPRIKTKPTKQQFLAESHIVVTTSGTGHAIVDRVLAKKGYARHVALKVPSFLGVARLVALTELLVIAPRRFGEAVARQEHVRLVEPPVALPPYGVKQHWHERFNTDVANVWLRRTLANVMRSG